MNQINQLTKEYALEIKEKLIQANLSEQEANAVLLHLNQKTIADITEQLVNTLSDAEKEKLENTDEEASVETLAQIFKVTPEYLNQQYLKRFEYYIDNLTENLPALTEQLSN